jgi:polysaccharide biosynthesis transport protein
LNAMDRSVKTVDEAEASFGLPALAAVPDFRATPRSAPKADAQVEADEADAAGAYRLVAQAPDGPAAEAFRNLRATIALLAPEAARRISLFTSAVPSEGKSFTSANYALSLAQQGHRVLLIDGDLRRPSLHKIFEDARASQTAGGDSTPPGIVDCLVGNVPLADAVRYVSRADIDVGGDRSATDGQLAVLTGERRAPNPAELLGAHRFAELVSEASALFDRVVIDSAPILAVSDTLLMAPHVQIVCVVVRAAKTPRDAVQRTISLITTAGKPPAGIVLNRLPRRMASGYQYYGPRGYGETVYGGAYGAREATSTGSTRSRNGAS